MCRKKGYPAITDANLVLGRILPEFFPAIFGESEDQPLDADASFKALEEIAADVNSQSRKRGQPEKSVDEVRLFSDALYPFICEVEAFFCSSDFQSLRLMNPRSYGQHMEDPSQILAALQCRTTASAFLTPLPPDKASF